jgi:hypothetical protein
MEEHDRQAIAERLNKGRDALLNAARGVPEDVAHRAPGPGRWSILECVEHVAVAEEYMAAQIVAAKSSAAPLINKQRETAIQERGLDRTNRRESPDVARPKARFTTAQDAMQHFLACREKTIHFVENCNDDPRALLAEHPTLGQVNCYEMLLLMAVHPARHASQIEEIKVALK